MWSRHTSPSIISTPFHLHNVRSISLISCLLSSKNTFLRYFGANTMWYLQFHFVCAKLFPVKISFFINPPFVLLVATGRSQLLLYTNGGFYSTVNLFWTPRLSGGFLFTQKNAANYSVLIVIILVLLMQNTRV